jgi:D-threo-aldose 1-dehydrogenase
MPTISECRTLGATSVRITRLGLGCAALGNLYREVDDADARATVQQAWDAGVRFFDTAPLYGHGLSELRLGAALAGSVADRADAVVATKVGRLLEAGPPGDTIFAAMPPVRPVYDYSADGIRRSLDDSLARLGLDRVDVLHVHDPDHHETDALRGAFPALRRLRDEGVIGAIGAGMNQSAMLTRFVRDAGIDCALLAGRYTLLDQSALDDLLPAATSAGVSLICGGVFNSGLLADPRPGATFDYATAPPSLVERAHHLHAVCRRHDVSAVAAAMQFPLAHPAVASVIVGARSGDEIRGNCLAFELELPSALWDDLRSEGFLRDDAPTPG